MSARITRRNALATLGSAAAGAVALPLAARTEQRGTPVIGVLTLTDTLLAGPFIRALHQGLGDEGFVEGRDVGIEYRRAEGKYEQLPAMAADLVKREVAVIAANAGLVVAQAAMAATKTIPIVFNYGGDPVKDGLVASFNRPGGNITGVTFLSNVLTGKRLERMRDVLPDAKIVGVLANPKNANVEDDLNELKAGARKLGITLMVLMVTSQEEIDAAFATMSQQKIQALFVTSDAYLSSVHTSLIVALALRHGIATCVANDSAVRVGGLMTYTDRRSDIYRHYGATIGRVLKGAKPADIPVIQPVNFSLVINLTTARALGLTISKEILFLADEVIE